jgi:hypothetical protein
MRRVLIAVLGVATSASADSGRLAYAFRFQDMRGQERTSARGESVHPVTEVFAWDAVTHASKLLFSDERTDVVIGTQSGSGDSPGGMIVAARNRLFATGGDRTPENLANPYYARGWLLELSTDGVNKVRRIAQYDAAEPLYAIATTPDGERLAFLGDGKKLHVYATKDGADLGSIDTQASFRGCRLLLLGWRDAHQVIFGSEAEGDAHFADNCGSKGLFSLDFDANGEPKRMSAGALSKSNRNFVGGPALAGGDASLKRWSDGRAIGLRFEKRRVEIPPTIPSAQGFRTEQQPILVMLDEKGAETGKSELPLPQRPEKSFKFFGLVGWME